MSVCRDCVLWPVWKQQKKAKTVLTVTIEIWITPTTLNEKLKGKYRIINLFFNQ